MTDDDDRKSVASVLVEVDFPASRDELVEAAQYVDADEKIIVMFQSLPDEEYADRSSAIAAIIAG